MSVVKKLILGLLTASVLLGAVELILRLAVPREALLFEFEHPEGGWFFEQTGNLAMRAGRTETLHDGSHAYTYTINDQGYREVEAVPFAKEPGTTRVLALGDSWMFGMNATTGKDVPGQLEDLVPARGGPPLDVVNGGIMGASGFDMLQQWRKSTALELDGVLVGMPHNDGRQADAQALRDEFYEGRPPGPASDLRIYLGLRRLLAAQLRRPHAVLTDVEGAIADVELIVREARDRGLDVWFVYWPTSWEAVQKRFWKPEQPPWIEALRPHGVPTTGHQLPERSCWGYHDDSHPSEAGYRVLAEVVAELMVGGDSHDVGRTTPTCAQVEECGPGKEGCAAAEDGPSFRLLANPLTPGEDPPPGDVEGAPSPMPVLQQEHGERRPDDRPPPPGATEGQLLPGQVAPPVQGQAPPENPPPE